MKYIIKLFLFLVIPFSTLAQFPTIDNVSYFLSGTQAWARGFDPGEDFDGNLVIPSTVEYNGVTYSVTQIMGQAFKDKTSITSLTLGENITEISSNAFYNCTNIECELILPPNLVTIDMNAFAFCSKLYGTCVLPNSVKTLGSNAFQGCSSLSGVVLSESLTELPTGVFSQCYSLEGEIKIPENVTVIGGSAFNECSRLSYLILHDGITSIGSYAFNNCAGWQGKLFIPSQLTVISESTFSGCSKLTDFYIPQSVTSIGNSAFKDCAGFEDQIFIPDNVTSIGTYAFRGCTGFSSIYLGKGIKTLNTGTFYGCTGLIGSVTLPSTLTAIPQYLFYRCSGIEQVIFSEGVKTIAKNAFDGCTSLTGNIELPSITTIADYAFNGCSNITSLTLGENVAAIGAYSFSGCASLQNIVSNAAVAPSCQSTSFYNVPKTIPLYVPEGCLDNYSGALAWKDFINIGDNMIDVTSIEILMDDTPLSGTITVDQNKPFILTAKVSPENATFQNVTWSTPNSALINLQRQDDGSVWVNPFKLGEYEITATSIDGKSSNTIVFNVIYTNLDGVKITNEQVELHAPQTLQLNIEFTPSNATNQKVTWQSSNPEIATVDSNGLVTAIKAGSSIITVIPDDENSTVDQYTVTVIPYTVSYYVEGELVETQEYEYEDVIEPLEAPEKEGYTFSEWEGLPTTMPQQNIEVEAVYTINSYTITYYIDNEFYTTQKYEYGEIITPPEVILEDSNKKFEGWITAIPVTMPAQNIAIYGSTTEVSSVSTIKNNNIKWNIYSTSGLLLMVDVNYIEALNKLNSGIYIFTNSKETHKITIR